MTSPHKRYRLRYYSNTEPEGVPKRNVFHLFVGLLVLVIASVVLYTVARTIYGFFVNPLKLFS